MEREPMHLKIDGDILEVTIKGRTYIGCIAGCVDNYFLSMLKINQPNNILFKLAGINDEHLFQREILGYSTKKGVYPYCHTREDVIRLAKAVVDYNNGQFQIKGDFFLRKRKNIKFNFNL